MNTVSRINFLFVLFFLCICGIIARLFYWQIISADNFAAAAKSQHSDYLQLPANRGEILAADGFSLAGNEKAFLVYVSMPEIKLPIAEIAEKISSVSATPGASLKEELTEKLSRKGSAWIPLLNKIGNAERDKISKMKIAGVGFEEERTRRYPEASMAAHLLGFVGEADSGGKRGYFGLEGFYDRELKGVDGWLRREKDLYGAPILVGDFEKQIAKNGRNLITTIERPIQFAVERELEKSIEKYGAKSGSVLVMKPKTGEILAMASYPKFDPRFFGKFSNDLFVNPAISRLYEPGSTFKILVMAAALNEKLVTPETVCPKCNGPLTVADIKIRNWNDKYPLNPTMVEIIEQSNNIGMAYVGERLGQDKLFDYLDRLSLGHLTGIDLEGEVSAFLRPKDNWTEVDLATASFGQGIAITPIQMLSSANVLANEGRFVRPMMVKKVVDGQEEILIKPQVGKRVFSEEAVRGITEMMVGAVDKGEAKWCKPAGYKIAGKTGTAQIPVAGHYDEEKTIASFVGFAPADDPVFTMLVTLQEPTSSPWGSETAAPLWFTIAKEIFLYYGIQPKY